MTQDFGQRVMAAAGVARYGGCCFCGRTMPMHLTGGDGACESFQTGYPDPLTPEGFCSLWDALEALGCRVEFRTLSDGTLSQVYKADELGRPDLASIFQGGHENRAAALLEAAAQALGVTR